MVGIVKIYRLNSDPAVTVEATRIIERPFALVRIGDEWIKTDKLGDYYVTEDDPGLWQSLRDFDHFPPPAVGDFKVLIDGKMYWRNRADFERDYRSSCGSRAGDVLTISWSDKGEPTLYHDTESAFAPRFSEVQHVG